MLSVTRHHVPADRADEFRAAAESAVLLLRARPGLLTATVGRSTDDETLWVVVTTWVDVGSFRRALSAFEVKVGAVPLLASALDEPTAFETLMVADAVGVQSRPSDRAADADWAGPSSRR